MPNPLLFHNDPKGGGACRCSEGNSFAYYISSRLIALAIQKLTDDRLVDRNGLQRSFEVGSLRSQDFES